MRHVRQTAGSLLLAALLCMALTVTAFAAEDGTVWLTLTEDSGRTTAEIVSDTTVTDGVVELTYDSTALTYEGVEVEEVYVAMYAVNAEEAGVVRISWVAPGEYEAVETGAELIHVNFSGEAEPEDISLSGTANNAAGESVYIRTEVVTVDTSALEEAIAKAEELKSSDYTSESWAALEKALTEGKAVLEDPNATQEEVDAAAERLNAAIAALVKAEAPKPEETPTPGTGTTGTDGSFGDVAPLELLVGLVVCAAAVLVGVLARYRRAKR